MVNVFVEICREGAVLPKYARLGDAGMDLFAAEEILIRPGETRIIPTGLKLAIPEGYEVQIRPRSGVSLKTFLRVSNSPGTIDSGYRDELGIIITNTSPVCCCNEEGIHTIDSDGNLTGTYRVRKGDRIAQMVLQIVPRMKLMVVDSVAGIGTDRGGGFGSSGTK